MTTRYGSIDNDELVLLPDLLGDTPDHTYGDYGDDIFYAGYGHGIDYIYGDEGIDLLSIDYAANIYTGADAGLSLNYSSNISVIRREGAGYLIDRINHQSIERYTVKGTDAKDYIDTYNHGTLGYSDIILGNGGDDTIQTYLGVDRIDGGDGNDRIYTNDGGDVINGGSGDDLIIARLTGGNTQIDGGAGLDVLVTQADFSSATTRLVFTDTGATQKTVSLADGTSIAGMEYFDQLFTGSGNDVITYSSDRFQLINTGAGDDTIAAGIGSDQIQGGLGNDLLKLDYTRHSYLAGVSLQLSYAYNGPMIEHSGDVALQRIGSSTVDRAAFTGINRFDIKGTSHADRLLGGLYNDRFAGYDGQDTLSGNRGLDSLLGGLGDDQLSGGYDQDTLTGSGGSDRFVFELDAAFSPSIGIDTITDFAVRVDRIVVDKTTFTALADVAEGSLPATAFASVTTDTAAQTSNALIVYNRTSGALFYNANGAEAGWGTGAQFATLSNLAKLTAANILVQA